MTKVVGNTAYSNPAARMGSSAGFVAPHEAEPLLINAGRRDGRRVVTTRRFIQSVLFFALVIAASFAIMSRFFRHQWWSVSLLPKACNTNNLSLVNRVLIDLQGTKDGHWGSCQREDFVHHKTFPSADFATGGSFSILEERRDPKSHGHGQVSTSGTITFRRIPRDRADTSTGFVTVEVRATDKELLDGVEEYVQFDASPRVLNVSSPWHVDGLPSGVSHCVRIEIVAWVPWDATFEHLIVDTVSLGIDVFDDISVHASETVSFKTTWGSIKLPGSDEVVASEGAIEWQPRDADSDKSIHEPQPGINGKSTSIGSVSGAVSGKLALYESLSINTVSGHISTILTPKDLPGESNPPAVLNLSSQSGRIETWLPVDTWAATTMSKRDYKTLVTTVSGSIRGSYYIGSQAEFRSASGTLSFAVLGGMTEDGQSFTTATVSGSQQIEVLSAAQDSTSIQGIEALRHLHSNHKSTSGRIHVVYPEQWEGKIDLQSTSGRLEATGHGVKVVSENHGFPKSLHAVKGDGASSSVITGINVSSRIEVLVGQRD